MSSLLAGLAAVVLFAAPPEDKKEAAAVKEKAEEVCKLFLKGDFAKFADLTHPAVVKEAGGRDKIIELLTMKVKDLKDRGIEFVSMKVADPTDAATAGDERYVVVPYALEMKVPDGKATVKTYLLAVSSDKGKTWTFVDGAGLKDDAMRKKVLPNLPEALKLPKDEKPVFEKDK
jgi:hypothetical protein